MVWEMQISSWFWREWSRSCSAGEESRRLAQRAVVERINFDLEIHWHVSPFLLFLLSYQVQTLVKHIYGNLTSWSSSNVSNLRSVSCWVFIIEQVPVEMSPILYHNALSPPSRTALLTIRNLGLEVEVKVIDTYKGEQNTPEYLKINPQHQVPVYVDDDFILTESRAIACYLASSAKSKLYPLDLKKRAFVDSRLYFDATNSFPVIRDFAVSRD